MEGTDKAKETEYLSNISTKKDQEFCTTLKSIGRK